MARLPSLDKEHAHKDAHRYYEVDEERYGAVLNNTMVYAHNVLVLRAMKGVVASYNELQLIPGALKSLIRLRVAGLNGRPF